MNDIKECCDTCGFLLTEGGVEACRYWEKPKDNIHEDKCSQYVTCLDLQC